MNSEPGLPDEPTATLADSGRWQFGLKDLFGLMTYVAATLGLVVWFGPGTLATSLGMLVAILNVRGVFAPWQRGWARWVLLAAAWVTFLVSLAMPCVSLGFGYVWGWDAAKTMLVSPLERMFLGRGMEYGPHWLWILSVDAANVLLACLPIYLWRLSRQRGQWYAAALCLAMTSVWSTNWQLTMYVGYYVWLASTGLALVAIPLRWQVLLGMLAWCTVLAVMDILNWPKL